MFFSCTPCCASADDLHQFGFDGGPREPGAEAIDICDQSPRSKAALLASKPDELPGLMPSLLMSKAHRRFGDLHARKFEMLKTVVEGEEPEQLAVDSEEGPLGFAASAARGRRCVCVLEDTGARMSAEYFVDANSGSLVLTVTEQGRRPESLVCPVRSIEDIYTIDDGEECFPGHMIKSLTPAERAGLFLIVISAADADIEPTSVYLVEVSQSARDDLLKHLQDLLVQN
mmetsp:Transcript_45531/g.114717  ORF Transcript_45531/g.114717 Transcript_45531/m.114717 type:complete len:229 (+) Transcript_45531:121-807(+)